MKKDKKWVLHSSLSGITAFILTATKQYIARRDRCEMPYFAVGMNRTEELARQLQGSWCAGLEDKQRLLEALAHCITISWLTLSTLPV